MNFFYAVGNPAVHQLPDFLAENGFRNRPPPGQPPCVWHRSGNTDLGLYDWLGTQPEMLANFQRLMTVPRGGDWLGAVPFADAGASGPGRTVFVDVGGNIGHQSARLKAAHPELAGRIVVQDLPETISKASRTDGVRFMAHDFFTPQPVEGQSVLCPATLVGVNRS